MLAFVGLFFLVVGLIHFYIWKRLVTDPLPVGRSRRVATIAAVVLTLLVPANLIGVRTGYVTWLAWPGYLWLAVMFYLLVTLVLLEIPRLVLVLLWRSRRRTENVAQNEPDAADRWDVAEPAELGVADAVNHAEGRADLESQAKSAGSPNENAEGRATGGQARSAEDQVQSTGSRARSAENEPQSAGSQAQGAAEGAAKGAAEDPAEGAGSETGAKPEPTAKDEADGVERRLVLARGMAIFAGLTAVGITGYGVKTALGTPRLDRVQLPLAKLPRAMDGTRLAVVSDIHLGPLTGTRHAGRIVDLINSVQADIVCVVGDLVDGSVAELGRFAAPLADIRSRHGAFFVTGNHEYYSGYQEWVAEVARLKVRPLRNERVAIGGLDLAGVNDLGGAAMGDPPDFGRALGDRDTARPVVLMAHQPIAAVQAAPFGVDLQVSGHTHGGQMAPFNLLVKLQQPVVSGLGTVDGVPVYVTNGAGFWGPPVRVGAPPQVTVIELRTT